MGDVVINLYYIYKINIKKISHYAKSKYKCENFLKKLNPNDLVNELYTLRKELSLSQHTDNFLRIINNDTN